MFKNYGDVNFLEHGRLVKQTGATEYEVLYCEPYSDVEDRYVFSKLAVDTSDNWIQDRKRELEEYFGDSDCDPAWFALSAIDYFGPDNFSPALEYACDWHSLTGAEVRELMVPYMDEIEKEVRI